MLEKRDSLPAAEHSRLSKLAEEHLTTLPELAQAAHPLFFISFRSEVDTCSIIKRRLEQGLAVLVPKSLISERKLEIYRIRSFEHDLKPGAYGILEPDPASAELVDSPFLIDFVLVPGSVFDRKCGRYGYGGGFYDRFLANEAVNALRVGYAFSFQVLDSIPLLPHDQRLHLVVTDEGTISCRGTV